MNPYINQPPNQWLYAVVEFGPIRHIL